MIKASLTDFLKMDMKGKVITAVELPRYSSQDIYIRTYKRALRLQQCVAYVNAAFNFQLDASTNYTVKKKPIILFGGISSTKIHAETTEEFLIGKALGDPLILKGLKLDKINHNLHCEHFMSSTLQTPSCDFSRG
ncbi:xanthine dehydrogenase [Plakobranchus ocellatus]|uniref:Xanthine dehydrogenase n=1 Tax=Plakobranchus ocellatus TaxID=259542 RepID=A0AAV4CE80_9GAST|nr:xanthine dehydrogenase [Plakobranchus ocellatus]